MYHAITNSATGVSLMAPAGAGLKAHGFQIPPMLLALADEVIE
jgi:hypothetical protein